MFKLNSTKVVTSFSLDDSLNATVEATVHSGQMVHIRHPLHDVNLQHVLGIHGAKGWFPSRRRVRFRNPEDSNRKLGGHILDVT